MQKVNKVSNVPLSSQAFGLFTQAGDEIRVRVLDLQKEEAEVLTQADMEKRMFDVTEIVQP